MTSLSRPLPPATATASVLAWFKATLDALSKAADIPGFTPIESGLDTILPGSGGSKPDSGSVRAKVPHTACVAAAQNQDFWLMATITISTSAGVTYHDPLLYIVEKHSRPRPSGWGIAQAYGKPVGSRVPIPDPAKLLSNIRTRMAQGQTAPPPLVGSTSSPKLPDEIMVYPDPGDRTGVASVMLHIPCIQLPTAAVREIVAIVRKVRDPGYEAIHEDLLPPAPEAPARSIREMAALFEKAAVDAIRAVAAGSDSTNPP